MLSQPMLIDTDPGVDDALAILMAHAHTEVVGLSVAAGNVGLSHTVANALKLVEVMQADIPVFAGCATPLVLPAEDAAYVHGADGYGDTGFVPASRQASSEHAALAILRLSHEYAGRLVLVALAPLTNLALALRLDPGLPSRVARLVVMGGAVSGRGNTASIPAEFNIGFDPEAAHVVFESWPRFELVDWEATTRHGLDFDLVARWLASGNPRARFYDAISRRTRAWTVANGGTQLLAADGLAMAVALDPGLVTERLSRHVAIEMQGRLTRGATVVDWEQRSGRAANADIVMAVDQQRFEAMIAASLEA